MSDGTSLSFSLQPIILCSSCPVVMCVLPVKGRECRHDVIQECSCVVDGVPPINPTISARLFALGLTIKLLRSLFSVSKPVSLPHPFPTPAPHPSRQAASVDMMSSKDARVSLMLIADES